MIRTLHLRWWVENLTVKVTKYELAKPNNLFFDIIHLDSELCLRGQHTIKSSQPKFDSLYRRIMEIIVA